MERDPNQHQGTLEHLTSVVLYAPIGFALEARHLLPLLVDRGRGQIKLARATGHRALERRRQWLDDQAGHASRALQAAGRGLGLLPGSEPVAPQSDEDRAPEASPAPPTVIPAGDTAAVPGPSSDHSTLAARPAGQVDPTALAIPDYDSLSASQVVPRLAALSAPDLELVWQYEQAGRGRRTILNKISQLRSS